MANPETGRLSSDEKAELGTAHVHEIIREQIAPTLPWINIVSAQIVKREVKVNGDWETEEYLGVGIQLPGNLDLAEDVPIRIDHDNPWNLDPAQAILIGRLGNQSHVFIDRNNHVRQAVTQHEAPTQLRFEVERALNYQSLRAEQVRKEAELANAEWERQAVPEISAPEATQAVLHIVDADNRRVA